jgi:beta-lactamase regulating signal transducer with metallopeptidase domain
MNSLSLGGDWLVRSAAAGALVLLLAWLLASRVRQPSLRQRLGEWGLVSALVLPILCLAPAWLLVSVPDPVETVVKDATAEGPAPAQTSLDASAVTPYPAAGPISPALPAAGTIDDSARQPASFFPWESAPAYTETEGTSPAGALPHVENQTPSAAVAPETPVAEAATPPPSIFSFDWRLWLTFAYLLGAVVFLTHWLFGQFALGRLLRRALAAPPAVQDLFNEICRGKARATLLVSDRLRVPMSCGLLRPTIVIPRALCSPAAERHLRWVFAHELTHLARHDAWACLLFHVGRVVYFYLPWFWWLRRQSRLCQEYVADNAAAPAAEAADYAQFLLGLTRAPALPAGATGVTGSTSDLFRRITMLLQPPRFTNPRATWLGSLAAALGIAALAVILSGVGVRADVATAPPEVDKKDPAKKDEPKKDDTKKDAADKEKVKDKDNNKDKPAAADDVEQLRRDIEKLQKQQSDAMRKLFEKLRGADANDVDQIRKEIDAIQREVGADLQKKMQMLQELQRRRFPAGVPGADFAPVNPFRNVDGFPLGYGGRHPQEGRLGVQVEKPDATLVEQLDLPKGQGLVVEQVKADSAAAKAGIKPHDILLEINGKAVPDNIGELVKALADIKPDQKVDAVVLRKGKKETLKGLTLPEAKPADNLFGGGNFPPPDIRIDVPNLLPPNAVPPGFPPPGGIRLGGGGGVGSVMTSTFITGDRFTTRHQEGSLIITVSGAVTDGKAKTSEILVQDGNKSEKYDSVDKVPEAYRDKVKNLVDMSEKNKIKIEVKNP